MKAIVPAPRALAQAATRHGDKCGMASCRRLLVAVLATVLVGGGVLPGAAQATALTGAGKAKLVMKGGRVHTGGGVVQAIAVDSRGVIIALGSSAEMDQLVDGATQVVDLAGRTVLPGFHDVHVHPLFAGMRERECVVEQGSTLRQTQEAVKACVQRAGPGKWVTGGQWDASAIGRVPDRAMLDAVSGGTPVLLNDTSGHSAVANTRALEIAGITRDTPDPKGGIIERDANGEPTGVLREDAIGLVAKHMPAPAAEEVRAALVWSLQEMLANGITSFTEASLGFAAGIEQELKVYADLADTGVLRQRARLCLNWDRGDPAAAALIEARNLYARERVATDCVKIFLDGVPTDSHTAAMLEPYEGTVEGRDDEASRKGLLLVAQDALDEAVTRFDRMGLTVKFHAAGDAAVRAGLNAIEAARKANGLIGPRHDVGHCTFVARADLPRARAIAATFEVSPYLWGPSPINDDITRAAGEARIARVWPVREMLDAGALVVPGSDWAVVPSVNPWIAVETLVTREMPGGSEKSFGKPQAVSLGEAIDLFTVNSARHAGASDRLGRIAPGMLADLVVLDRDPFEILATELHKTTVLKTIINGEIVYERR